MTTPTPENQVPEAVRMLIAMEEKHAPYFSDMARYKDTPPPCEFCVQASSYTHTYYTAIEAQWPCEPLRTIRALASKDTREQAAVIMALERGEQ